MRFALPLLLLLAACGRPAAHGDAEADTIGCTIGNAAPTRCAVDRGDRHQLVIRHPDGGFRRLAIADDGRGILTADGAEQARVRILGDRMIEVAIGDDRYRLPATVKARAR